jgi:hypothetical protein
MEPTEILGSAAQVAVTLAGFAGVVVVFGSASVHEWSPVDKFRLRLMLLSSSLALALCMLGLVLLAAGLPSERAWRFGSGLIVATMLPAQISGIATFLRFPAEELRRTGASRAIFYASNTVGFALIALQVANATVIAEFWPFLLTVVLSILISLLQFVRLILSRREDA